MWKLFASNLFHSKVIWSSKFPGKASLVSDGLISNGPIWKQKSVYLPLRHFLVIGLHSSQLATYLLTDRYSIIARGRLCGRSLASARSPVSFGIHPYGPTLDRDACLSVASAGYCSSCVRELLRTLSMNIELLHNLCRELLVHGTVKFEMFALWKFSRIRVTRN